MNRTARTADEEAEYRAHIKQVVDTLPPLDKDQRTRLGSLLRPGVVVMHAAIREREAAGRNAKHSNGGS